MQSTQYTINPTQYIYVGIDPGNKQSGWAVIQGGKIVGSGVDENDALMRFTFWNTADIIAIEWIQSMGMVVGKEVFETCLWAGRMTQASGCLVRLIPRGRIKLHHCGSSRAKDGNVVQSLKDKYGDKGTKKQPGYFYGVSSHAWQAFAVAAYVMEGANDPSEIVTHKNADALLLARLARLEYVGEIKTND